MSSIFFGAGDLLEYNSAFKLLICRQCQYAIQKNALDSHLLRHKIYRTERQDLLTSIAHLELLEPEEVAIPAADRPPVDGLPVLSGLRCADSGCEHLTVSSKRMRRHWTECHGLDGTVVATASLARAVILQTFFRGTKVRYFEVTPLSDGGGTPGTRSSSVRQDDYNMIEADAKDDVPAPAPAGSRASTKGPGPSQDGLPNNSYHLDLATLSYLYHFMTETSSTLPVIHTSQNSRTYWQFHVIPQALHRRWLMCGVLAVSAHHLAVLTEDFGLEQSHRDRMANFSSEFFDGLNELSGRVFDMETAMVEAGSKQVGTLIKFLLKCASWTLPNSLYEVESPDQSKLSVFMGIIRDSVMSDLSNYYPEATSTSRGSQETVSAGPVLNCDALPIRHIDSESRNSTTPPLILNRLRMLPFHLVNRLERPETMEQPWTAIAAIASLIKCCDAAFVQSEASAMWQCIAAWSTNLPDHFNQMLMDHHPAALIILAHWTSMLVLRAEKASLWYLRGLSEAMMLEISTQLASRDTTALDMIENLTAFAGD